MAPTSNLVDMLHLEYWNETILVRQTIDDCKVDGQMDVTICS